MSTPRTWIRRATLALIAIYLAIFSATLAFIELYDGPTNLPMGAVIVVLGAGQRDDGSMGKFTAQRLWAGVALFRATSADRLVLTGGKLAHEPRIVAEAMAAAALSAGLPAERLLIEPRALSTLQNALFTAGMLGPEEVPIVLVTHRFQLPRAWASFHWAGLHDLTLYPVDEASEHWTRFGVGMIFRESLKSLLNTARAGFASVVDLLGLPQSAYERLLD